MTESATEYLKSLMKAVEQLSMIVDEGAERGSGGSKVEVEWDDLNTVVGFFGDLYSIMKRVKEKR